VTCRVLWATISTFNLALAHHLQGLIRPAQSYPTLKKAAKLYDYAIHFAQCSNNGLIWPLILNNLNDVYRRLGDVVRAGQCCEDLLCTLAQVSDSKEMSAEIIRVLYPNSFCSLLSSRGTTSRRQRNSKTNPVTASPRSRTDR